MNRTSTTITKIRSYRDQVGVVERQFSLETPAQACQAVIGKEAQKYRTFPWAVKSLCPASDTPTLRSGTKEKRHRNIWL